MIQRKPKQKFLPLREVVVTSRPLVKRAITFSCDGELAVAADDSVYVFVPEFPDFPRRSAQREKQQTGHIAEAASGLTHGSKDSSEDDEESGFENYRNKTRAQYSEGIKHIPVSFPPLDPRINKELFVSAGVPFPYDADGGVDQADDEDSEDFDSENDDDEEAGPSGGSNRPFGAGFGPITGVGSSMNHVVQMAWSPSGLGANLRPILAILTGAGVVAVYGDGAKLDNVLPHANEGMLQRRQLNSWIVLWGVGERLMVPNQQADVSEYIQAIAWAEQVAPGQALLATINDVREVAIISVQTIFTIDESKAKDASTTIGDTAEKLEWVVHEVARFKAEGPHGKAETTDPDWTPCGTSFGLNWSRWVEDGDYHTTLLSFVDRNYVGFRRIRVKSDWVRGKIPEVRVGSTDSAGQCVHLSTDAFVKFENAVWEAEGVQSCRGFVASPFYVLPFEVAITPETSSDLPPHTTAECGTTYSDEGLVPPSENPIVDLIIHPVDTSCPPSSPIPYYTLIRLSATPTNSDWYETNLPRPPDDPLPQWARDIAQKLEIAMPAGMYLRRGYGDVSDPEGSDDEDPDTGALDSASEFEDDNNIPQGPEIYPHRFRLHGLAISPGGGVTAVLASVHNTQHPERGGWHTVKSSVFFSHKRRQRTRDLGQAVFEPQFPGLTVEARFFEHLYGGGPPVPGINAPIPVEGFAIDPVTRRLQEQRIRFRELFRDALERQTCDLCGSNMAPSRAKTSGLTGCEKGHYFGTCGTSGLAVQMPGITRSCGTCGLRSMRTSMLMKKVPDKAEEIIREVGDGLCGGCGGKFLN